MNKNRKFKKTIAAAAALLMGASALFPAAAVPASAAETKTWGEIAVNPDIHYQTLEGWGTSLCWWGNVIGSWGDADWNGNGRPDREEIAELAFSPEYLNLNIVRYNVGGGDKEDTSIKRIEGVVPGWTEDMTGTKDGSGAFDPDAFYSKSTEEMSDAGQLWMLEQEPRLRTVRLCLDHDAAGIEAAGRLTDALRERGYEDVSVLRPEYKDWAEDLKALIRAAAKNNPPDSAIFPKITYICTTYPRPA